jgi:hypothetical protein
MLKTVKSLARVNGQPADVYLEMQEESQDPFQELMQMWHR